LTNTAIRAYKGDPKEGKSREKREGEEEKKKRKSPQNS
jgi:hypothetical protein